MNTAYAHPILTCAEAKDLEARLFGADESKEWAAMQAAGAAVAGAVLADFEEVGGFPATGTILVLAGKGHNGGDALLAAAQILRQHPRAHAEVWLVYGVRALRPLALRAWQELQHAAPERVKAVTGRSLRRRYALSLDGVFGYQFRPPLDERATAALRLANLLDVRLRAAVDLPSGWDAPEAFRADFTYATGIVKAPLLNLPNAGRRRYLDLGFFAGDEPGGDRVLTASVLAPLRAWRDPHADKRKNGHVFILGGSRDYPGAVFMAVLAAVRSGVGLVSAFVPESLVPAFAAKVPEAIWVGCPETPDGGLALEGRHRVVERWSRATALVVGPGLGREKETQALVADLLKTASVPAVVDADALQPEIIRAAKTPLILTPHAGEFARIAGDRSLPDYAATTKATVVLKGPVTRIAIGAATIHSFFGGPVLARGGSGDLLAGLIGAQLAQTPADPAGAASRGVAWHGLAADALARAKGSTAVRTTQVLGYLGVVLRTAEA
ncbi:MAG: NAD(P)H-hydrate dehydratase [Opitutaceae bacterium]|nr:NAD(P)H-hydrate dehydratase [Opitutaceae bacterium]